LICIVGRWNWTSLESHPGGFSRHFQNSVCRKQRFVCDFGAFARLNKGLLVASKGLLATDKGLFRANKGSFAASQDLVATDKGLVGATKGLSTAKEAFVVVS
jgi:hypothetical protein